jgi:amidohydrolase
VLVVDAAAAVADIVPGLIELRRRLHANPELAGAEYETTETILARLRLAGLSPFRLGGGAGVVCDIGPVEEPYVVLRADIDALAVDDVKTVPYRSRIPGVAHACGHDVHTAVVLGTGLALAGLLPEGAAGGIRLVFEPREETVPGGAVEVIDEGWLEGAGAVFGLHCDPKLDVGQVGLRVGPITSACDVVEIRVHGPGGHTARPHLTVDLAAVAGRLAAELQGALERRLDGAGDVRMVFGVLHAGTAANVIPTTATLRGTLRTPSPEVWAMAPELLQAAVGELLGQTGATWEIDHARGVPAVVNDASAIAVVAEAGAEVLGVDELRETEHSMGGDSFAWYLEKVPGAYVRLGVHDPASSRRLDLHSGSFDVDERCIGHGVRLLAVTALKAHERLQVDGHL